MRISLTSGWASLRQSKKVEITLMVIFVVWLLMVVLAPLTLPAGSVKDLSGKVGEIDNSVQLDGMNPFARVIYTLGDINCHQLPDRSLFINWNQMPFCVRDVGIFIGLILGLAIAILLNVRITFLVFAIGILPLVTDGVLQLFTDYESSNAIRIATGALGGVAISLLLSRFIKEVFDRYEPACTYGNENEMPKEQEGEAGRH